MATVDFQAQKDTFINGGAGFTTTNYGSSADVRIGTSLLGANIMRGLWHFTVSGIAADKVVTKVEIIFTNVATAGGGFNNMTFHAMNETGWTSAGATWATYDGSTAWATPNTTPDPGAGPYGASPSVTYAIPTAAGTYTYDITSLFTTTGWDGATTQVHILLKRSDEHNAGAGNGYFYTRSLNDGTASNRPILRVTYTNATGKCISDARIATATDQAATAEAGFGASYVGDINDQVITTFPIYRETGADPPAAGTEYNNWLRMAEVAYKSCQNAFFTRSAADYLQANIDLRNIARVWPMNGDARPKILASASGTGTTLTQTVADNRHDMFGGATMWAYRICVAYSLLVADDELEIETNDDVNTYIFDRLITAMDNVGHADYTANSDSPYPAQRGVDLLTYMAIKQCKGIAAATVSTLARDGWAVAAVPSPTYAGPNGYETDGTPVFRGLSKILDEEEDDGLWTFDGTELWYWAMCSDNSLIPALSQVYADLTVGEQTIFDRVYYRPLKMLCVTPDNPDGTYGAHPFIRGITSLGWENFMGFTAARWWGPDELDYDVQWALNEIFRRNYAENGLAYHYFEDLTIEFDPSTDFSTPPSIATGDRSFSDRMDIIEKATYTAVRHYKDYDWTAVDNPDRPTAHATTAFGTEKIFHNGTRIWLSGFPALDSSGVENDMRLRGTGRDLRQRVSSLRDVRLSRGFSSGTRCVRGRRL